MWTIALIVYLPDGSATNLWRCHLHKRQGSWGMGRGRGRAGAGEGERVVGASERESSGRLLFVFLFFTIICHYTKSQWGSWGVQGGSLPNLHLLPSSLLLLHHRPRAHPLADECSTKSSINWHFQFAVPSLFPVGVTLSNNSPARPELSPPPPTAPLTCHPLLHSPASLFLLFPFRFDFGLSSILPVWHCLIL